jgi:hypothetical protein
MAGYVYGNFGEKAVLALRYIAEHTPFGQAKAWNGNVQQLEQCLGITRPQAMARLQELTGTDSIQATRLLWDSYSPHLYVWIPFAVIGLMAAVALWIFGRMAKRWSDMNA